MKIRYIVIGIGIAVLALMEVSLSGDDTLLYFFSPSLAAVIFISLIASRGLAVSMAVLSGIVFDMFSYLPFGVITLSFVLVWALVALLYTSYFSDYSIFTIFVLVLIATFVQDMFVYLASHLLSFFGMVDIVVRLTGEHFIQLGWHVVINAVLVMVLFAFATRISKQLNVKTLQGTRGLR